MTKPDRTKRLAHEMIAANRVAMAVILRDVPPSYNWGFYSREDPRMHLQVVDSQHRRLGYKVWLEERGRRVFQPEPSIPVKVLKSLQQEVARMRDGIEHDWVALMIGKGWITIRVEWPIIRIIAYPRTPNQFERELNLLKELPGAAREVTAENTVLSQEMGCLELFSNRAENRRVHIRLHPILWQGDL